MNKTLYFLLFVLLYFPLSMNTASKHETFDEYGVKFSFVYRVCIFTQWPGTPKPNRPFTISVLGELPTRTDFLIPEGLTIQNRPVQLNKIKRLAQIGNSEVLFIAASESHRIDDVLDYISGRPILTVGDTKGFGQKGVIINLFLKDGHVKFEINHRASKKASLRMHSQLFTIGKVVDPVLQNDTHEKKFHRRN